MTPHSSLLAQRIPWTEEPGGLHPRGHKEPDTTERTRTHAVRVGLVATAQGPAAALPCGFLLLF